MKREKYLDKLTDLMEDTLVKKGVSDDFTVDYDEDEMTVSLKGDYSDVSYVKNVEDLFEQKKEQDIKLKDQYKDSGIKSDVKNYIEEHIHDKENYFSSHRDTYEDEEDYEEDEDLDEYDDFDEDEDYDEDEDEYEDEDEEEDEEVKEYFFTDEKEPSQETHSSVNKVLVTNENASGLFTVDTEVPSPFKVAFKDENGEFLKEDPGVLEDGKPVIVDMGELIGGFFNVEKAEKTGQLVVTNESKNFGAVMICKKDVLDSISSMLDTDDFLIIPSSIHEIICVKTDNFEKSIPEMEEIIRSVNEEQVSEKEKLSDIPYVYSKEDGRILTGEQYLEEKREKECPGFDLPWD